MTNKTYSKGIFLNILNNNQNQWQKDIDYFKNFTDLNHLEIWLETDLSTKDIDWLKNKLSKYTLIVHGPFINLSLISHRQEINEASMNIYKRYIDYSINLGAKLITLHAGAHPMMFDDMTVRHLFINNFLKLVKYANNKIIVTIENNTAHSPVHVSYPIYLKEFEEFNKNSKKINFTLDVGHCIQHNLDFFQFLKDNINQIKNIHLHNGITNGSAHFGLQKPGNLKRIRLIKLLEKEKYSGFVSLEVLKNEDKIKSWNLF